MNLSVNYNVGLRKLFGQGAPKQGPSAFAVRLHAGLGLKNLLESLNPLLCG
jgi:hypothetical protein